MLALTAPLPLALLSLVLSLAAPPLADARATPKRSLDGGLSVPMTRRPHPLRSGTLEERAAWAQRNRLRTEVKYGKKGSLEKRSSGLNL